MITEEAMATIISLSISNKIVEYRDVKEFITIEGMEDEEKLYFSLYFIDLPDGKMETQMAFTSKHNKVEVYNGSFKAIAEKLFKATETDFMLIGDRIIEVEDFNFKAM